MKKQHDIYTGILPRGVYLAKCLCGWEGTAKTEAEAIALHDEAQQVAA
jgi:hypothetical protein